MWENEHKKTIIRNIIIFLVLAFFVAALVIALMNAKGKIAEEDRQLSAASSNQRQELNEARQENIDVILQAYDTDLQTVEQYLPGIVCWGDSLTTGSSGNVSYPFTLQKYINTYLCDIYDFRSTIENADDYARLKWNDYKISIPVVNMGGGQENTATILGRAGTPSFVTKGDFYIPADLESVAVTLTAPDGTAVAPLTAGAVGINPVRIGNVEGTLSVVTSAYSWQQYEYQFTRLEAGAEEFVPAGTEIITAAHDEYKNYIHVVWLGTYENYWSPEALVSDVSQLLSRQAENPDRYIVIGPCTIKGTWNMASSNLDPIDTAMMQAFGSHYINTRKYLIEDGLRDAGITPTKEDSTHLKRGVVPASFRSHAAGADLNGVAYKLIGKLVYERMDQLGYFDEVRSELGIDQSMQKILKNDPQYFNKMLNAN